MHWEASLGVAVIQDAGVYLQILQVLSSLALPGPQDRVTGCEQSFWRAER
jgi:hypothetical protein